MAAVATPVEAQVEGPARPQAPSVADARVLRRIGIIEGDDNFVFGGIRDLGVDSGGNVFILDAHALNVRWFGSDDAHRHTIGGAGGGPGEFRGPVALEVTPDGDIHVLDAVLRRITRFVRSDSGLSLARILPVPVFGLDFCALGGSYYILNAQDTGIITVVDTSGSVINSFGDYIGEIPKELQAHTRVLRERLTRGRLACIESPPTIVAMSERLPTVRAFTPSGELKWSSDLLNFHMQRNVVSRSGRGLTTAPDAKTGTAHTALYVSLAGKSMVAVSLVESSMVARTREYELRLLSLVDGRERTPLKVPYDIAAFTPRVGWGIQHQPFPVVVAFALPPNLDR